MWTFLAALALITLLAIAVVRLFFYEYWIQLRLTFHMGLGATDRALPLVRAQLERLRRTKGDHHLDTAVALFQLGQIEYERGRREEGRARVQQAAAFFAQHQGSQNIVFMAHLEGLAAALNEVEIYDQASAVMRRIVEEWRVWKGGQSLQFGRSLSNLGVVLTRAGQATDAVTVLEEGLVIQLTHRAESSMEIGIARLNLGEAYIDVKRFTEAERNLQHASEVLAKFATQEVGHTFDTYARLREEQERWAEAEQLRTSALIAFQRALGENHVEVAKQMEKQATLLDRLHRDTERDLYRRKAKHIREALACTLS